VYSVPLDRFLKIIIIVYKNKTYKRLLWYAYGADV
jgi:hypothetical protein